MLSAAVVRTPAGAEESLPGTPPAPPTPCIRLPDVGELAQQGWAGRGPAPEPRDSTAGWVCSCQTVVLVGVCWFPQPHARLKSRADCTGADAHSLLVGPHPGSQGSLAFTGNCVLSPHTHWTELPRVIFDCFLRKRCICVRCYFKVFIENKPVKTSTVKKRC